MKKFISIIALSLASFASMAAMVSFPDSIEVIGVNGLSKVDSRYIQLDSGEHLIELQYRDIFEVNADDANWVKSEPLYLHLDIDKIGNYQARLPNIFSEEEAYDFIQNPFVDLDDGMGGKKRVQLLTHQQLMAKLLLSKK